MNNEGQRFHRLGLTIMCGCPVTASTFSPFRSDSTLVCIGFLERYRTVLESYIIDITHIGIPKTPF